MNVPASIAWLLMFAIWSPLTVNLVGEEATINKV